MKADGRNALLEEWYEHSGKLLELIREFSGHEIKAPDTPHDKEVAKIVAFRFAQSIRTFQSIIQLTKAGDGSNSFVLMRMLFEALVDVAYLVNNPRDVWRYLEEAAELEAKLRKAARQYAPPIAERMGGKRTSPESLRSQFHNLAEKESDCKSWRRLSLRARAQKSGYLDIADLYEMVYPTASAYIHGASGILLDYLRDIEGGEVEFRVDYDRTDKEVEPAAGISAMIFLRLIGFLDALFQFGLRSQVEALFDEQQRLLSRSQQHMSERFGG